MRTTMLALTMLVSCSPADPPAVPPAADPNAPEKSKTITRGGPYGTADYLVPGYVTLLDFYAEW